LRARHRGSKALADAGVNARKHSLALELERLDQLQQVFGARALEGDVASGALVAKIIERRCTMLGLYTPPANSRAARRAN
jgi:hypothetical protein